MCWRKTCSCGGKLKSLTRIKLVLQQWQVGSSRTSGASPNDGYQKQWGSSRAPCLPVLRTSWAAHSRGEPSVVVLPVLGETQPSACPPARDSPQETSCCCMWRPSQSIAQLLYFYSLLMHRMILGLQRKFSMPFRKQNRQLCFTKQANQPTCKWPSS